MSLATTYAVDRQTASEDNELQQTKDWLQQVEERKKVSQAAKAEDGEIITDDYLKRAQSSWTDYAKDMVPAVGTGLIQAGQNTVNLFIDAVDLADEYVGDGTLLDKDDRLTFANDPDKIYQPTTLPGKFTKSVSQFMIPFSGVNKVMKGAGLLNNFARATAAGAVTDLAVFDSLEENLSNFLQDTPLANPINAYLAVNPKDTALLNRAKTAVEGVLLGMGMEGVSKGFMKALDFYRARRITFAKRAEAEEMHKLINEVEGIQKKTVGEGDGAKTVIDEKDVKVQEIINKVKEKRSAGDEVVNTEAVESMMYIRDNKELNKAIQEKVASYGTLKEESRRGVQPLAESKRLADLMDMSHEQLMSRPIGQATNAETYRAQADLIEDNANLVVEAVKKAKKSGSLQDKAGVIAAYNKYVTEMAHMEGGLSEGARTMNVAKNVYKSMDQNTANRVLREYTKAGGGDKGVDVLIEHLEGALSGAEPPAKQMSKIFRRFKYASEGAYYYFVTNILSGFKTHLTNTTVNAAVAANAILETRIAHGSVEAAAQWSGMRNSLQDAMNVFKKSFKEGSTSFAKTKLEGLAKSPFSPKRLSDEFVSMKKLLYKNEDQLTSLGVAVDVLSKAFDVPGRALVAADDFFKTVHIRGKEAQLATREGLLKQVAEGWDAEKTAKFIQDRIDNPTYKMTKESMQEAEKLTFTNPVKDSKLAQSIKNFSEIGAPIAQPLKVVVPFVRTPFNVFKYTLDRSPLNPALWDEAFFSGIGTARKEAQARFAVGSTVTALGAGLSALGFIQGTGPENVYTRRMMEQNGVLSHSVKIPGIDKSFRFDRFDTFGSMLSVGADAADLIHAMADDDPDRHLVAFAAAGVLAKNYLPELMTENMREFLNIMSGDPKEGSKARRYFSNLASSFVIPWSAALRDISGLVDPVKRNTAPDPKAWLPVWDEFVNKMKAKIPGLSKTLPPKRNLFGEVMAMNTAYASYKDDPVLNEILRLSDTEIIQGDVQEGEASFNITMPSKFISSGILGKRINRQLSPEEYDQYVQLSAGIGLKTRNKTLHEELSDEVKSWSRAKGMWGSDSDEARKLSIKKIILDYRKEARNQLKYMENPDIEREFLIEKQNRINKIMTPQ